VSKFLAFVHVADVYLYDGCTDGAYAVE
jgi:hypothetical protein